MQTESLKNVSPTIGNAVLPAVPSQERKVALCWATKKRHIAVDGEVLCDPKHKTNGYSVKNGGYNSLSLSGIPTHSKLSNDIKGSHGDGIISFMPLEEQPLFIDTSSICSKCLKKYETLWHSS